MEEKNEDGQDMSDPDDEYDKWRERECEELELDLKILQDKWCVHKLGYYHGNPTKFVQHATEYLKETIRDKEWDALIAEGDKEFPVKEIPQGRRQICPSCKKEYQAQLKRPDGDNRPIQQIFPHEALWKREELISFLCRNCQEPIFRKPEGEEEDENTEL